MTCDPEWDDEVDVVCTDSGVAGLATAISAVDEDGEVFLAELPAPKDATSRRPHSGWFTGVGDEATDRYFSELTADIDIPGLTRCDADLPVRLAGQAVPARRRPIPTFEGQRLREWAARCIPSPTGYLYTQVTDWTSATIDFGDQELKVTEIGAVTPDPERPIASVREFLIEEALDRDVSPHPVSRFDGLVFEDGFVVGAVFSTDKGPRMIRARHGVLICRNEIDSGDPLDGHLPDDAAVRVALVGKEASRFGRVELLTSDAEVAERMRPTPAITISKS